MNNSLIGELVTIGRNSGKEHRVYLRFVFYNNKYYVSRRNANSDWLKNLMVNPTARIVVDGRIIKCLAKIIDDQALSSIISRLKYNDERSSINRIVIELEPV